MIEPSPAEPGTKQTLHGRRNGLTNHSAGCLIKLLATAIAVHTVTFISACYSLICISTLLYM
jgi:hypothetical protein